MDESQMPKVDLQKDASKLKPMDLLYMKRVEEINLKRVKTLQQTRRSNNILSVTLGLTAFAIYLYTIYSVKQEKFLDDFEEPKKIIEKPSAAL